MNDVLVDVLPPLANVSLEQLQFGDTQARQIKPLSHRPRWFWRETAYGRYRSVHLPDLRRWWAWPPSRNEFMIPSQDDLHRDNPGYVYFAQVDRYVKIGYSGKIWGRLLTLQSLCPLSVCVVGIIQDANMVSWNSMEKMMHAKFSHLHHRGEWFHCVGRLREFIQQLQGIAM